MEKQTIPNDQLESTLDRLIRMCEANVEMNVQNIEMKISRPYKGEKKMRVIGDLYGVPIGHDPNKGITLVRVNAARMLGKLRNSKEQLLKELGILRNGN